MAERIRPSMDLPERAETSRIVAAFSPQAARNRGTREETEAAAGFESREAVGGSALSPDRFRTADSAQDVHTRRKPRLFKTGRSATITIRASQTTIDRFYAAADQLEAKAADAFEQAIEALETKLARDGAGEGIPP